MVEKLGRLYHDYQSKLTEMQVIIIGAGIAGLSCARRLTQNGGIEVLILEGRNRVGGRIHTWDLKDNKTYNPKEHERISFPIDLGASFIHGVSKGHPVKELEKKVGFTTFDSEKDESAFIFLDCQSGKKLKEEEAEKVAFFSQGLIFDLLIKKLNEIRKESKGEKPLPNETLWSALLTRKDDSIYGKLWEQIESEEEREIVMTMSKMWTGWTGALHWDLSLRWWGAENDFHGGNEVVLPGYQTLIQWSAEKATSKGAKIELNKVIEKVQRLQDNKILVQAQDGSQYHADYLISSIPLGVMQNSPPIFEPDLPESLQRSISNLGMGLLNKIVLRYEIAWWHKLSLPSFFCILPTQIAKKDQDYRLKSERIPKTIKEAEYLVENEGIFAQNYDIINRSPLLKIFLGPPIADAVELLDNDWIIKTIHNRLVKSILPKEEQASIPFPASSRVTRWNQDPFSRGSYSYIPALGQTSKNSGGSRQDMEIAATSIWNNTLGFCGEHTSADCYASVHGALLSGEREADRILNILHKFKAIRMPQGNDLENDVVEASANYQTIYKKCLNRDAACITLTFLQGFVKASQVPITNGDQLECANDGNANQICSYKNQGGAYVYCAGSDPVIVSNKGNVLTATYPGIIARKVSTSGEGTSIFSVTCLVKA